MPLIICPDCGRKVSDQAPTCMGCGRPTSSANAGAPIGAGKLFLFGLGALIFIVPLCAKLQENRSAAAGNAAAANADAAAHCRTDLACFAEKHFVAASVRCVPEVERQAKFTHEWTDGTLEPKFRRYRWKDQSAGVVTYLGDKIRFQNGFGAWQNMSYECDFDTATDQPLAARVSEGKMQ